MLPNHFHFIIKIKPEAAIQKELTGLRQTTKSERNFLESNDINRLAEMTFKRLFTSYAMAFNKMYKRSGNLFYRTFKRVVIANNDYFTHSIIYVHANAQRHKIASDFHLHKWTSYHSILSNKPTKLLRNELIEWFGSRQGFIDAHTVLADYCYNSPEAVDDDE